MKRSITENLLICILLCVIILLVYYRVGGYDFINYDDDHYVYQNRTVKSGLTLGGIYWAFTLSHGDGSYWQPLTWMSHMLDCTLFGMNARLHHLHSLIIHILNSILLFLLFRWMTGDGRKSAFLAAMFAVHPINVDSVAWISERKNVLSTFFFLSSMTAYVYYTRKPDLQRYLTIILLFVTGLLAKPMLITLPFVLLLMDYWPLKRCRFLSKDGPGSNGKSTLWLISEKVPLLIISLFFTHLAKSSLATNWVTFDQVPLTLRILNVPLSYVRYVGKILLPAELSIHYPFPIMIPTWQGLGAFVLILAAIFFASRFSDKYPYGLVFLVWFLGTLVPVIGFIQTGLWPAMADRWMYIPAIGVFGIISWGGGDLLKNGDLAKGAYRLAVVTAIAVFMAISWFQVGHWVDSISVFRHALAVTDNNLIAHNNLGNALTEQGRMDEAIFHYTEALRIKPDHANTHNNLGTALYFKGDIARAEFHCRESLKLDPNNAKAHNNLGVVLSAEGNIKGALRSYTEALRIDPYYAEAYNNLGLLLLETGSVENSIKLFEKALRLREDYTKAHDNLEKAKNIMQAD